MKKITKYQVLKWLVLFTAVFAVICFFTPFAVVSLRNPNGSVYSTTIVYGYGFLLTEQKGLNISLAILTWISFLIALTAVAFAVISLVMKDTNGLNKKGKFHKSLIISSALSLSSVLINFFSMLILAIGEARWMSLHSLSNVHIHYNAFQCFFTYIGLIVVIALLIPVIILAVKARVDMIKAKNAPATESTEAGEVAEVKTKKPVASPKKQNAPQTATDNPENKPLEWFTSEEGLKAFKTYMTAQNYILEENLIKEREQKYSDWEFDEFLQICHKDVKLPCQYYSALIANIDAQPLQYVGPHKALIEMLKLISKPYDIDDDGEPVARALIMPPEQILSVEKNPLLNFVKNFDVFVMKDDEVGTLKDKISLYIDIMFFISANIYRLVIEDNKWLFDKSTYVNDFGIIRTEKAFLKKCKELTEYSEYFDAKLAELG